MDEGIEKLEPR